MIDEVDWVRSSYNNCNYKEEADSLCSNPTGSEQLLERKATTKFKILKKRKE